MFKIMPKIIFLFIVLFMFTCNAGAEEGLLWPVERDLMVKVWSNNEVQTWGTIGEVKMWNTRDNLYIYVKPADHDPDIPEEYVDYRILELNINISFNDTEDFTAIVNKKGKPTPGKFNHKFEFPSPGVDDYLFSLPIHPDLDLCWGNPDICPVIRYIIVHAELSRYDGVRGEYENIGEGALPSAMESSVRMSGETAKRKKSTGAGTTPIRSPRWRPGISWTQRSKG